MPAPAAAVVMGGFSVGCDDAVLTVAPVAAKVAC